jgi:hypothetical protein
MADKDSTSKTELTQVVWSSSAMSYVSNLLLGILFALFFGQDVLNNWVKYRGTGE